MGDEIARATYKERRAMEDLMMSNSTPVPNADGHHIRKWHEGWNAERVAKEVNPRFTASHWHAVQKELIISFKAQRSTTGEITRAEFEEFKQLVLERLRDLDSEVFGDAPPPRRPKKR